MTSDDDGRHLGRRQSYVSGKPMALVRAADIGQPELGEKAVRQRHDVVGQGEQVGRSPVGLDNAAFGAVAQNDPVPKHIRAAEVERDARKYVAQRILERQSKDDGKDARGGDQRSDRHAEDKSEDRQQHPNVDDADDEVLQKARLARLSLEHEIDADKPDQRPGEVNPPEHLGRSDEDRSGGCLIAPCRLVGNDSSVKKQDRHGKEEGDLDDQPGGGEPLRNDVPNDNAGETDQHHVERGEFHQLMTVPGST